MIPLYEVSRIDKLTETKSRIKVTWDLEGSSYYVMGKAFLFVLMKKFWK